MKAVLFDMDGVLVDSEIFYMQGTYEWIKEKGFKGSFSDVFTLIGTTMQETYQIIYKMLNGKYTLEEIEQMNTKYFTDNPICYKKIVKSGVYEVLEFLKENNIKMALCSSSPKNYIKNILQECNFEKYFDFIISADDVIKSKPDPTIYLKAIEELKVLNDECFVIEDSKSGIQAGKNANIKVIAIKDDRFYQDQTRADYIFTNMKDILEFLKNEIR